VWDRFSPAEMERRFALARDLMREEELSALVLFGNSGVSRGNMANAFWLSNHLDLHHCYLVVPADPGQDAALYTGLTNHVPNAREVTDVPIVDSGGYNPAEQVVDRLRAIGVTHGRAGLVGVNSKFSMGMPYAHHAHVRSELPELELVDVTGRFQRLRTVKSEEEIDWLRKAAELTDRGITALAERARPGMNDVELVALAESAYRPAGGIPRIMFLRSMGMDDPNGCLPAQNPSRRRIKRGDVIITEFSASYWGYTGQIQRPVFVRAEPTTEWQNLFEVALESYQAIREVLRPGATEAEVVEAAEPIRAADLAIYDDLVHGYGVDIMPPIVDRDQLRNPPDDGGATFERGAAVVIQPNPVTLDERMGLQLGELTIVREGGAESLHAVPLDEPLIAGA
jgi:Xaa-Pro aminopeptidase